MDGPERRTVRVRIEGRVQGVGFRYWMESECNALGLTGWVRNRRDGSVEAVISGDGELVEEMIDQCRHGPAGARVTEVEVVGGERDDYAGFEIRPTI
jgi:acylphosphatase